MHSYLSLLLLLTPTAKSAGDWAQNITCSTHPLSWTSCTRASSLLDSKPGPYGIQILSTTNRTGLLEQWYDGRSDCVLRLGFQDTLPSADPLNLTIAQGEFGIFKARDLAKNAVENGDRLFGCQGKSVRVWLPTQIEGGGYEEGNVGWYFEAVSAVEAFLAHID